MLYCRETQLDTEERKTDIQLNREINGESQSEGDLINILQMLFERN